MTDGRRMEQKQILTRCTFERKIEDGTWPMAY